MDRLIGKFLDNRYEILEVIGMGGMAIVYKAKCHRLNRMVAIKVLKNEYAKDAEFRKRFHDESQSVAMLSHPNIVAVYDVSRSDDIEYIVMELIEGFTLKEYLKSRKQLSWQETSFFAIQIAKALDHAHSRGIIHRDIKPQNIMLLRDGTVKVADFGIARQMTQQNTYNIGEAIGSVHYVSPEQARGSHVDNRADLYSFGVVMYEMLCGRLPFEGDSAVSVAVQHINSIPLPPSDYVAGIPETIENITMKAMAPSLSKRYASAAQMLTDLENFRNDPSYKVEISTEDTFAGYIESDSDATRKINNTGEAKRPAARGKEGTEYAQKKKGSARYSVVFAVVSVLLFVVGAFYFISAVIDPFGGGGTEKIEVPSLISLAVDEVKSDPKYVDFVIQEGESVYDDSVNAGKIISQKPEGGKMAEKGSVITVVISRGPKTIALKEYATFDYRQVQIDLDRLGLVMVEQHEFSDEVAKDTVIRTMPGAGTTVSAGESIIVVISDGKELKDIPMPDLMGKTEAEARDLLKASGLECGIVTPIDSTKKDGTVIFQAFPAGSTVKEGTVVDLQISRNPEPTIKSKTITFEVMGAVGEIYVQVKVDGVVQYNAVHASSDGELFVPLSAAEGYHTITIMQNDIVTFEEKVLF